MANYLCSIPSQLEENYQIGVRSGVWGVEEKYSHRIKPVQAGDKVVFIVGGRYRSVHRIESQPFIDNTELWPRKDGSLFPHRIRMSRPEFEGDFPASQLADQISFMKGKAWPGTIQGPNGVFNDRLTDRDLQLIASHLGAAMGAAEPPPRSEETPKARQSRERQEALLRFYEDDIEARLLAYLPQLGLRLFAGSDGRSGRQYVCPVGRIDLLCTEEKSNFVVVELKKGEAPEQTLLQLLRYMSWVRQNLAKGRDVRGIIVAESADQNLRQIVGEVPGVSIQYYRVAIDFL